RGPRAGCAVRPEGRGRAANGGLDRCDRGSTTRRDGPRAHSRARASGRRRRTLTTPPAPLLRHLSANRVELCCQVLPGERADLVAGARDHVLGAGRVRNRPILACRYGDRGDRAGGCDDCDYDGGALLHDPLLLPRLTHGSSLGGASPRVVRARDVANVTVATQPSG